MDDKQVARRVPGTVLSSSEVTSLRDVITEAAHAYELAAVTQLRAVREAAEILGQDMRSIAEQEARVAQEQARELAAARGALAEEETRAQVLAHLAAEAREAAATLLDRGALAYLRGTGDTLAGAVQQHTAPDESAAAAFADAQKARIDLRIALLKLAHAHFDAQDWARTRDVLKSLADSASGPLTREALMLLHATYLEEAVTASSSDWAYARASMAAATEISHGLTTDHELAKQFMDATTRLVESARATGRTAEALSLIVLAREHLGVEHPELRRASLLGRGGTRLSGNCLQEFGGHRQPVQDVAFTPDGEHVVSVDGADIKRWRTPSASPGALVATFPAQHAYRFIRSTLAAATTDGTLLSTADGTVIGQLDMAGDTATPGNSSPGQVAAFSSSTDGSVVAWTRRVQRYVTVKVIDNGRQSYSKPPSAQSLVGVLQPLRSVIMPPQWPLTEAFHKDQSWACDYYGTLEVKGYPIDGISIANSRTVQAARWMAAEPKPIVLRLVVSPGGRFVAWLNPFGQLAIVEAATGVPIHTFHMDASSTIHDALDISLQDRLVIAAQGKAVTAWNITTGAKMLSYQFPDVIGAVRLSPDEGTVATLSIKGDISLCDIKEQPSPVVIGHHGPVSSPCIAFSPDGARLVTSGNHLIKVWSLA